jgi:UDP-glucose 4-epimerase
MYPMKVLVTGGAGYIGSHAVLALQETGFSPIVIDNLSTGTESAVPPGVSLEIGDIGDVRFLERTIAHHEVEAVMHFAASCVVPDSVERPLEYYRNNAANSVGLIDACVRLRVRYFIFSSTAAVYGVPKQLPVDEDATLRPINPYGWSKMMTEQVLQDVHAAQDLRYLILRYFNVAGADPQGRAGQRGRRNTYLVKVACETVLQKRPTLSIFGNDFPTADGTGVRDYVHVSDLATAHVLALTYLVSGGESCVLNCGYGRGYSVREVIDAVERAAGKSLPVLVEPRRPGDPAALVARSDRIRRLLGWTPKFDSIDGIVRSALDWEERLARDPPTST